MSGQSDWPWESELARVAALVEPSAMRREAARLPLDRLAEIRERWWQVATDVSPVDPGWARAALSHLYAAGGLHPPKVVATARSPYEGLLLTAIERYAAGGRSGAIAATLRPSARETLSFVTAIGPALALALWHEVALPLHRQLGVGDTPFAMPAGLEQDPLARCVRRSMLDRLADGAPASGAAPPRRPTRPPRLFPIHRYVQLHAQAFASTQPALPAKTVWRYLAAAARSGVARPWWTLTGPRAIADAGYLAWLEAAQQLGNRLTESQSAQIEVGRACSWAWSLETSAIITDRPAQLDQTALRSLHCSDQPIAVFRDGTAAWSWHGRPLPATFFVPGWSVHRAMRAADVEERRCAAERIGWARFVRRAQLRCIGREADPANPGAQLALYAPPPWRPDRRRLLVCVNGTASADGLRRTYGLWVPREITSALQAAAWTYGLDPDFYATAARRS